MGFVKRCVSRLARWLRPRKTALQEVRCCNGAELIFDSVCIGIEHSIALIECCGRKLTASTGLVAEGVFDLSRNSC